MLKNSPLKKAVGTPADAENLALGAEKSRPPRVLVVDDEALLRWSVAETLGDQGWQVTEAADAKSAMVAFPDIARRAAWSFSICDCRTPTICTSWRPCVVCRRTRR